MFYLVIFSIQTITYFTDELTLNIAEDKYFIGNNEVYGYYRVNYDVENWNKIIDALMSNYEVIILLFSLFYYTDYFSIYNNSLSFL